jgi:hypothetical protein
VYNRAVAAGIDLDGGAEWEPVFSGSEHGVGYYR